MCHVPVSQAVLQLGHALILGKIGPQRRLKLVLLTFSAKGLCQNQRLGMLRHLRLSKATQGAS